MPTIASLCSGAGGIELAAESLFGELEHLWFAEIDKDAAKVYAAHWPVPNLGDITVVDWATAERPDIIATGFPCQPWSQAGQRAGREDERDLWPIRKTDADGRLRRGVVDAIRELRPGLLLFENVASLVRAEDGSAWSTILADLHALGYAASWTTVGACKVGACHHRHRVYLAATLADVTSPETAPVAWLDGGRWFGTDGDLFGGFTSFADWPRAGLSVGGSVWALPEDVCGTSGIVLPTPRASDTGTAGRRAGEGWRPPLSQVALNMLPTPTATPYGNNQSPSAGAAVRPSLESLVAMLPTPNASDAQGGTRAVPDSRTHGGPDHGPRLRDVAPTLLPTPSAHLDPGERGFPSQETAAARLASGRRNLEDAVALLPTPTVADSRGSRNATAGRSPGAVAASRFGDYATAVCRHEALLGGPAPKPTEPGTKGKPRLTAAFPEWMCAFPVGWITDHVGRSAAIRIAGNSVVWPAAAYAYSTLPTLAVPAPAAA
jgi:DNA (cytosine-5)-methyltransferase 1